MTNNCKKTISKNIFSLILLQIVNYVFPLMAWPILTNILGVSDFGILVMLFSICSIANIFTDFGFDLSATYTVSSNIKNKDLIGNLLSNVFLIKLTLSFLTILSVYGYLYFWFDNNRINIYTYILIALIIFFQSCQYIWLFQGIEKMKYITIATVLSKTGYLLLLITITPFLKSINSALFCFFISQVLVSITHFICIYKEGFSFGKPMFSSLLNELKNSTGFFFSRVAVSIYTSLNILLLGTFQSTYIAGLYGAAEKLYFAGSKVSGVLSQALYPNMVKTGNLNLLLKIVLSLFIPFCLFCYVTSFFSQDIMRLIFGEAFIEGDKILDLFLILMCITFLSVSLGYPGFAAIRKIKLANYTVIVGAILHFIGLIILYAFNNLTAINLLNLVIITEVIILLLRIVFLLYYQKGKGVKL